LITGQNEFVGVIKIITLGLKYQYAMIRIMSTLCLVLASITNLFAQSDAELLSKAKKLQDERSHEEALKVYKQIYSKDSSNVEVVSNMSLCFSRSGALMTANSADQKKYYAEAKRLAKKSIAMNTQNANSHLAMAVALARENENASSKTKISNAKEIRSECDLVFKYDPDNATAFHIMGRWHRTFAGLNGFEKTMINTLYGGVPKGGTYADALEMFSKAIKIEPSLSMHVYELAVTYYEMGQKENAKKFANKVMDYPVKSKDDEKTRKECEKLLAKLK